MLIVDAYSYDAIKAIIEGYIVNSESDCWSTVAAKLSRIGAWEFEDYQS